MENKIIKKESKIYIVSLVCAAFFGGMFLKDSIAQKIPISGPVDNILPSYAAVSAGGLKSVPGITHGIPNAPFTLIEFGDYYCGPCRLQTSKLNEYLTQYKDKLNFKFCNLPLEELHPLAPRAAKIGAAAKRLLPEDTAWKVHEELYEVTNNEKDLDDIEKKYNIKMDNAKDNKFVKEQNDLTIKYHVNATPSYFLCTPDGKAFQLKNLSSIEPLLR
jgi:protein-disulfide isomerase